MKKGNPFCGLETYFCESVVVGSGASGFNAFDTLLDGGNDRVVLITEDVKGGTSRNTGSDKQTYYKLTLSGSDDDSVHALANDLFQGGCVDGDLALTEAANSASAFLKLSHLGVPFPKSRYGEYIGYKTDHDPHRRATSAGPYTSRFMTECLEKSVHQKRGEILDQTLVVHILVDKDSVQGLLCLDIKRSRLCIIWCRYVIWATGGPAAMYLNSVYPESQHGSSGLAFEAGCTAQNLTEWQYGLASVSPRWNVSGTYMQALPRFYSVDKEGREHDFLDEHLKEQAKRLSFTFLKGYQWPFDVTKVKEGSSIIDLLVYEELQKERRVFLDYRENPFDGELLAEGLFDEVADYLGRAGALFGKPIDRLRVMNEPAYQFYRDHGIDLVTDALEITLSAQHNNGGISVDSWNRTTVKGVFAVGEVAGTHGVVRPGGSALNGGQVGAMRAATFILGTRDTQESSVPAPCPSCKEVVQEMIGLIETAIGEEESVMHAFLKRKQAMSLFASAVRNENTIRQIRSEAEKMLANFSQLKISRSEQLPTLFRLRDTLISQIVYLSAMEEYCKTNGKSRGSALYLCPDGQIVNSILGEQYRTHFDDYGVDSPIQEVTYNNGKVAVKWRVARPIPTEDDFFENVWREYRKSGNVY